MADEKFTIKVSMRGEGAVVAGSKVVKGAVRDMSREVDTASRHMNQNVKATDELGRSHERAARSTHNMSSALKDTNARFTGLRNIIGTIKWPALIAGAGYAAQGLGALGAASVALVSALAPLAGALAAGPSLFASFAQGAGVAALALGGVMNALGAMETASLGAGETAASSGKAIESANEGVISAERALASSQTQAKLAQQSLTAARHEAVAELKDLKNASISAALGEERAVLSLREAKQSLRQAERTPGTTGNEIADLELGVRESRQSLHESRLSASRAHGEAARASTRGVSRNPQVVEQNRSLHEAQLSVRESAEGLAKAERSVGESMTESGGAASTLAQKMAALPPAAQTFAKFLYGLKPKLDTLRQTAAKGLLPGVERGITKALPLFPKLNKATGETAVTMAHLTERAGQMVGSKGFGHDFESITKSNTKVIGSLGGAGLSMADALRQVMVVAEPLVEWMATSVKVGAEQIDTLTKQGRASGTLAHFFGETRDVMEKVFTIGSNVAHAFWDIGKAAKPLGDEILVSFVHSSESLAKWTDSLKGQNELKEYFAEAKPGIFEFGRLIRDVTEDTVELSKGKGFFNLTRALRTELLPVLKEVIGNTAEAFGPVLVKALVQIGKLLGTLAGSSGPLTMFVTDVTSMIKILNGAFDNIPGLKTFAVTLIGIATVSKAMKFVGMITGLGSALSIAKKILVTMGLIEATQVGTGVVGGVETAASTIGTTAAAGKVLYGPTGEVISTVENTAGGAAAGAGASRGASIASKAGLMSEAGMITSKGLMLSGVATVAITAANALINPDKTGEDPAHEKELHLKGLEFNVSGGKSEVQLQSLARHFGKTMDKLRVDAAVGMGAIDRALETGLVQANETWEKGTPRWRKHTAEAMHGAVSEIRQGMRLGTISTEEGRDQIGKILRRLHLLTGKDPLGLSEEVTHEFKKTGQITAAGVSDFARQLQQMPKGAREQTRAATTAMLAAWADGHPKIERQVSALTQFMANKFGQSARAAKESQRGAMKSIIEQTTGASSSVARSLTTIGANLTSALRALGAHDLPQFKIQSEQRGHNLTPSAGEFAGGGITKVPGKGLHDNVPLRVNGGLSAIVAPGEDVMVVNRHQRPKLDRAVANEYGVSGMQGFFRANPTKHFMASGGFASDSIPLPRITGGSRSEREGDQRGVTQVWHAANVFLDRHSGVAKVIQNGSRMDALHQPYLWGGGHGPTASRNGPWDCSGGTSELADGSGLKGSDFNFPPMVSGGFGSWGKPGKGDFTVLSNNEHVYSVLKDHGRYRAIGTSEENPGGGFGWINGYTFRGGFNVRHADIGEMMRSGGNSGKGQAPVKGMAGGGFAKGPWAGTSIDKTYAQSDGISTGTVLPPYVIEALAEWAGLPGITMFQITEGESSGHPGMDISDPPGRGRGLYAMNSVTSGNTQSSSELRNPILNTLAAKGLVGSGLPNANIWHGSSHVTGWNLHYSGDPQKIAEHLGGGKKAKTSTASAAVAKTPAYVKGSLHAASSAGGVGPGGKGGETVHVQYPTQTISIDAAVPKTLHDVRAELGQRRHELGIQKQGLRLAKRQKDKGAEANFTANIEKLKARIKQLLDTQSKMVQQRVERKVGNKIARRGLFPPLEAIVASDEAAFLRASEIAGQTVTLEPNEPDLAYFAREGAGYTDELAIEAAQRNNLLNADHSAWQREIDLSYQISNIELLKQSHPKAWNKNKYKIPLLKAALTQAQETRTNWKSKLGEVQGPNGPLAEQGSLPSEPQPGVYGGNIFDTQVAIKELGLKVSDAVSAAADAKREEEEATAQEKRDAENGLLRERNDVLEREKRIHDAQQPVLADYLGMKLAGGKLPRDGYYFGHRDETVVPAGESSAPAGVHVLEPHIHVSDDLAPYISATIEQRFEKGGRRVGQGMSTPTAPGRRATMKGGR
jgi:hypothetical protein